MYIAILLMVSLAALWLLMRYLALKRTIRRANTQLLEISAQIEENYIVKLEAPDKDMEKLLMTINEALDAIRRAHMNYRQREQAFQSQIENISHDLRTPLTSVLGYLELIDTSKLDDDDRESLAVVKNKAHYLQRLIHQFYDLSRLTADDYPLNLVPVDIGKLLRESIVGFYQVLEKRSLAVDIHIPELPCMVMADPDGLERVFYNFLQNAVRYAEYTFSVRLETDGQSVDITFENDTTVIDVSDVSRIFERFYMSDSARSHGNTGLGLTIARQLTEKMGGSLSAQLIKKGEQQYLQLLCKMPII